MMALAACHNRCLLRDDGAEMMPNYGASQQPVASKATIQRQHWIAQTTHSQSQEHGSVGGLVGAMIDAMAGALLVQRACPRAFAKLRLLCCTRAPEAAACHKCVQARWVLSQRERAGRTRQSSGDAAWPAQAI